MTSTEAYNILQKDCGIEVGDKVRVLRKSRTYELGWQAAWVEDMDILITNKYEVIAINNDLGILLKDGWQSFWFPWFVLELVEKHIPEVTQPTPPTVVIQGL